MLTEKQSELLYFLDGEISERGVSPSYECMMETLGLKSKSGIGRLVSALEQRGFIRRMPGLARSIEVLRLPGDSSGSLQTLAEIETVLEDWDGKDAHTTARRIVRIFLRAKTSGRITSPATNHEPLHTTAH